MMNLLSKIFEAILNAYDAVWRLLTRTKLPERPAVEVPPGAVTIDITAQQDGLREGCIEWEREHRGVDLAEHEKPDDNPGYLKTMQRRNDTIAEVARRLELHPALNADPLIQLYDELWDKLGRPPSADELIEWRATEFERLPGRG